MNQSILETPNIDVAYHEPEVRIRPGCFRPGTPAFPFGAQQAMMAPENLRNFRTVTAAG